MYFTEKNLTRFNNIGYTYFLDPKDINKVKSKLNKNNYSIYYPYKDSEKNIVYKKNIPEVLLYEIKSKQPLRHQDILGTMYSLNISQDLFGDILIINNKYYVYILPILRNYFESNFNCIKNSRIELNEIDIDKFVDYEREYKKTELIVSSTRIDTVISSIIHTPRSEINSLISKKAIMINYDYLSNPDYKLKENDVFSIKKYGKYKFVGSKKKTKKDKLIVEVCKYI